MSTVVELYNYWAAIALMLIGLYVVIAHGNLVKKLIGLAIFQTSVFILFITLGKIDGGTAPIWIGDAAVYSHPLPHVLILTAIVVGISVTALGLALVVRIRDTWGTIEDDELSARQVQEHDRPPNV